MSTLYQLVSPYSPYISTIIRLGTLKLYSNTRKKDLDPDILYSNDVTLHFTCIALVIRAFFFEEYMLIYEKGFIAGQQHGKDVSAIV